jgi:hypothetical protein
MKYCKKYGRPMKEGEAVYSSCGRQDVYSLKPTTVFYQYIINNFPEISQYLNR